MRNFYTYFTILFLFFSATMSAQQLPNSQFEDWSGESFDGVAQPKYWNYSNVTQFGYKFNFAHQETGRNGGSCIMVQDQALEVMGIGETSPGYISLGQPWVYIESLTKVSEATAGTYGGIAWSHRPDTMSVWIKRTGAAAMDEDFHLLYYAWTGTAHGDKYKGKNGNCTEVSWDDEESDVRQSTDGNECGTTTAAHQVSEGWIRARAIYEDWVKINVPIYYMDNATPTKVNVIFSASNYPNFRANSGLNVGNSLYVDDLELIYSSKIHSLYINGSEWRGFDPNSTDVQTFVVGDAVTTTPSIKAYRGAGQLTNTKGITTTFLGRLLQGDEITITEGVIDETPTTITVRAEDGSSETTYQILFMHRASNNAYLNGIQVNGVELNNFNPYITEYEAEVAYGMTEAPVVTVTKQEDQQTITMTQPSSINDVTVITVTAADRTTTQTYTIKYKEAMLSDNTLSGILVNGVAIPDFLPTRTNYRVSIPLGTTEMPVVTPVSAYADGLQTITATAPDHIDGGVYQIAVTTPGNPTAKVYKITFKLELSSYCKLQNIFLDSIALSDFTADNTTYQVSLPIGTTELPEITYTPGDAYQTIEVATAGIDGTTRITVTAANGDKMVYKIVFSTAKSEISTLHDILIDGVSIPDFDSVKTVYYVQLPMGTTTLPRIEAVKGDEYERVDITYGDINSTTRISVSAGNGSMTVYQIVFSVEQSTNATLTNILVGGESLPGFDPNILEYSYALPKGTTVLPVISYVAHDSLQTITTRSGGVNGDYKITVRPQSGASQTYVIHFSVPKSSNTALQMIYLDRAPLANFDPEQLAYTDTLSSNTIPEVTYLANEGQRVINLLDGNTQTIKVTAESGATRVYTITFVVRKSDNAFLKMIYLNGDSLANFVFDQLTYSNLYIQGNACPKISVDHEEGQQVSILSPIGAGTANIIVTASAGGANTYMLHFVDTTTSIIAPLAPDTDYIYSTDVTLRTILIDGTPLTTFDAAQRSYTLNLAAGSTMPVVTFVPNSDKQSMVAGQTATGMYVANVTAENGDTAVYRVQITMAPYTNTLLKNLVVEGHDIHFDSNTFDYQLSIENGQVLPNITYATQPGQNVMVYTPNSNEQHIIVTAQNGAQSTYIITYTRIVSTNALLKDILIDGTSIAGFDPNQHTYTDTLAWRTKVVPSVNAIGMTKDQVITTYFSAVNGTTRIHVLAADGVTSSEYTIHFPTRQSSNVALSDLSLETTYAITFDFDPDQTDYIVTLPNNATLSPTISYETSEPEQRVSVLLAPMGQANQVIVQAENGEKRIYTITFVRESITQNILQAIYIAGFTDPLDLSDTNKRDFDVELPYDATNLAVSYRKNHPDQMVVVAPGGLYQPTVIRVYATNTATEPAVYTITPHLTTLNPATLSGIKIDGEAIADFAADRFSYIVNRSNANTVPSIDIQKASDVEVSTTIDLWKCTIQAVNGKYTNTYTLFFHYPADMIPNGEFNEWTKQAKAKTHPSLWNEGDYYDKPAQWNVPGDYLDLYAGTVKAGETFSKDGASVVHFNTVYWGALYGAIPPVMNLAHMNANFAVAGGSTVVPSGTIGFHNTPDQAIINYKYPNKAGDGALFRFLFTNINGDEFNTDHVQSSETSNYADYTINLNTDKQPISGMDVIVDATNLYPKAPSGPTTDCSSDLYVDYIRLAYNNRLRSLMVNDQTATFDGSTFSATLTNSDEVNIPTLTFTGEVSDQAQQITWNEPVNEGEYSIRRGVITNYGEDGSSSEYAIEIKRPLNSIVALSTIQIGGKPLATYNKEQLDYVYLLPIGTNALPDITPTLSNGLQSCTTSIVDSVATIQVMAENGSTRTYTVRFKAEEVTDATLQNIAAQGISYDANQFDYTIAAETMPAISITKRYDAQQVCMQGGVIDVTLANGTHQQYRIQLQKDMAETSGQLTELEVDGNVLTNFAPDTYTYQGDIPTICTFTRKDLSDSVVYIHKADTAIWKVIGSTTHTYQLTAPTLSMSQTELEGIYVEGQMIEGFSSQQNNYTIYSDSAIALSVVGSHPEQQISIQESERIYTIQVTAPDGITSATYTVRLLPVPSADATIKEVYLDGQAYELFNANTYQYTITLPAGSYKDHEPSLPALTYVPSHNQAQVEVELGGLGEKTSLFVTAQDSIHKSTYQFLFVAEPSHNATLTAIAINNQPIEHFEPNRYYYSIQIPDETITLDWRTNDRFQTITQYQDGSTFHIHVVAQDGVTEKDYVIETFKQALSNDATLSSIMLDGKDMSEYQVAINSGLSFHPGLNRYTINIPSTLDGLPDITATMRIDGQTMTMRQDASAIYLDVTAPDGLTSNTYTLLFNKALSNVTNLKMIYIDGDSLALFQPDQLLYFYDLPAGVHTMPAVDAIKAEVGQRIDSSTIVLPIGIQHTIYVTAEDGQAAAQYIVIFQTHPSDVDTLALLYADGLPIEGFDAHNYTYQFELPSSATYFPVISWEQGDAYQMVRTDTIESNEQTLICQYVVVAENGMSNRYTVSYVKQWSDITTLQMIYIGSDSLADFQPLVNEYVYTLPTNTTTIPNVYYDRGDNYQVINQNDSATSVISDIFATTHIDVQAQNGDTRSYVIYFILAPSTDTTLQMIYYNNMEVPRFDEQVFTYSIQMEKGDALLPSITFTKQMTEQLVDIAIVDSNRIQLNVTAEDRNYQSTYELIFLPYLSNNGTLNAIYADGELISGFDPMQDSYEINADSLSLLPVLTYDKAEDKQEVIIRSYNVMVDSVIRDIVQTLVVVPENKVDTGYYEITIHILSNIPMRPEDSDNARLAYLNIKGQLIGTAMGFDQDFDPEVRDYYITYPIGYNPDLFYMDSDITVMTQDTLARISAYNREIVRTATDTAGIDVPVSTCIHITVLAPNGNVWTYNVHQVLELDSVNHTTELIIADFQGVLRALSEFDTDVYYYEYILSDTRNNAPTFELHYDNMDSRFACVSFERDNDSHVVDASDLTNYAAVEGDEDPTYHLCYRAENGTKFIYKIKFRRSEIRRAQTPMEGDVLIQHIPGSYQIAVASLRANVVFGLYDLNGCMVELVKLEEGNPNSFNTTTDGFGQTYFGHLSDFSSCTILTLQPNKVYFWVFTENGKRKIKSGKLIIVP